MRYHVYQLSDKTDNFNFLGPNLPKNGFWGQKSGFRICTSNVWCVPIFSQNGQLLIFWPKFGEVAQLRAIFWFKYRWGCCRELGGGWNELGGGGWSWVDVEMSCVEVDGAGWRWVHGLAINFLQLMCFLRIWSHVLKKFFNKKLYFFNSAVCTFFDIYTT